jgi:multidrug efflux pump
MISRFFIDRPIFATVLSVVIMLIGGIALMYLPIAQYPRITPPGVAVSISYPGASAQVVADTVAAPIEQQFNGIENLLYMSSQMANDGTYTLTCTFDVGTDLKTALVMVQNRVTLAMPLLPTEVQNQGITIRKKTPDMLMIVNFYSPDGRYDDIYLSNYATIYAKDELLRVDGVSDISYQGQRDYSIRCWLDPQKLAACNMTAMDVATAIRQQNMDAAAGQLGQPPAATGQPFQLPIDTLGRLTDPEQFGDIIVKTGGLAAPRNNRSGRAPVSAVPEVDPSTTPAPLNTGSMTNDPTTSSSTQRPSTTTTPPTTTTVTGGLAGGAGTGGGATATGGGTTSGGATSAGGGTTGGAATTSTMAGLEINKQPSSAINRSATLGGATMGRGPAAPSASILRLRDVARIELGAQNYNTSCTFDGRPSVGLGIYQLPGTNALEVADRVRAKMEELKTRFPDGVDYAIGYDTTPYIRESIMDVVWTMLEAVALVGLVVLIFLQDWRAMILPMIDVPVSIVGTFAVMAVVGFSLNNISLFGLVLAIGIVVDDAIVVLENIERLIATGLDPRTATIKAMEEVTGPIVAVGLVLCAVFVPCAFISGITGHFFRQFAVTIAVSTVISAINAITMTPSRAVLIFKTKEGTKHELKREALPWWFFALVAGSLAAWFGPQYLEPAARAKIALAGAASSYVVWWTLTIVCFIAGALPGGLLGWIIIRPVNALLGGLFRAFNSGFDRVTSVYGLAVGHSLRLSVLMLVLYAGLLGLTYVVFHKAPTGFIPEQDQGRLIVSIQLPDGASLQRTEEAVAQVVRVTLQTPGVSHAVAFAGTSFLLSANSPNFASMFVVLSPFDERRRPGLRDTAIMAKLRKVWREQVPDADVTVYGGSPIPGLGAAGGFKLVVEDRGGLGFDALQEQTDKLVRKLKELPAQLDQPMGTPGWKPALNNVATQFRANTPQLFLDIDRTKAEALGVALIDVNQTLDMYLGSLYVNSYNEFGRHWQVTIQAEGDYRNDVDRINLLQVRNKWGEMVPLGTLVHAREVGGPLSVTRYNLYRAAIIRGNIQGVSTGDAMQNIIRVSDDTLPLSMKAEWTELMFLQERAGNTAFYIFLLSIVCVFLALSALYESWTLPLAVILVVPLCLLCSVGGVLATRRDVNIFVQIGLVVLVGLACKNAILIVEYAKQLHVEGRSCFAATLEASKLRLRPILMTSFAFIFGVIPLIVASGAGAEMRRSLGTAVFSGMLGVTLFGIFLTPVFFYVIQGVGESRLFSSERTQWIFSVAAGAGLGMGTASLLAQLHLVILWVALPVGAFAGVLSVLAVISIHRRIRTRS